MRSLVVLVFVGLLGCEHGKGGPLSGTCADLSLLDCRNTPGCAPDICPGCFCDQAYRGCLPESASPTPCPVLGCPSAVCCASDQQCDGGAACAPPGAEQGCGSCNPDPGNCVDDGECAGTEICEPVTCGCDGQRQCVAGCVADTTCAEGTSCDRASARCAPTPCRDDAGCPATFQCDGTSCVRTRCETDLDCDGFCVLGSCFSALGECRLPVP